jgi:patatin-like phospholipase/acyl hydrolase
MSQNINFIKIQELFISLYGRHESDVFPSNKFYSNRDDFSLFVEQKDTNKFKLCLHRKMYRTKLINIYYSVEELIDVLKIMIKSSLINKTQ